MRIEYLYRYPVKGLTAEALERAEVERGGAIPWDRAFALAHGDAAFDAANPTWLPKWHFMCLMKNAEVAKLFSVFDPSAGTLTIMAPNGTGVEANALSAAGRRDIGAFLTRYLGDQARGTPVFHHVPKHVFGDQKQPVIRLNNLASLHDYEAKVGARRHRRRFRDNIWFSGTPAWAERDWIGREMQIGGAVVRIVEGTTRDASTEVNPETAERDIDPVAELRSLYGHIEFGVQAEVIESGVFAIGDAMALL